MSSYNLSHFDAADMLANRRSIGPKADAAMRFAVKVADVRAVKLAGYDDAQVGEIVQHVALDSWTQNLAGTEIDFPAVTARQVVWVCVPPG